MNLLFFLKEPGNHLKLKLLQVVPLLFAILLLVDGFLPEKSVEQKEYHIYGYTGSGRYSDAGKYLKTPFQEITIADEVYDDLDHLQPVYFIQTPLLRTLKALVYESREQPGTSYEYRSIFSVYGLRSLWLCLLAGLSCVALFVNQPELENYASTSSWALTIFLLLAILI